MIHACSRMYVIFANNVWSMGSGMDAEQQEEALKQAFLYHMHDDMSAWVGALPLWIVC